MAIATTTLLIASAIATVVGAGVSAYSSIQAGKAAAAVGEANAAMAQQDSQAQIQSSEAETAAIRDRNRRVAASQRTSFLKSGITLDSGTAQDVMYDSAVQGELEALTTQYKGRVGATASSRSADVAIYEGQSRKMASNYQAAGTILSGVGNALSISSNPAFNKKKATA